MSATISFILSALPNELLDRIFSFLSEDQQAISASRRVCHAFKQLSSPYLITRVVFARRLKAIARFNEIVEHDYFRRYVTELVFDASSYEEDFATDWDTYVQCCLNAPQELRDAEWARRKLEEQAIWSNIEASREAKPETTPVSVRLASSDQTEDRREDRPCDGGVRQLGNDDLSVSDDEDDLSGSEDDDGIGSYDGPGSSSEYESGALRYYDQAYTLGCHQSFPDYHRLYMAQEQIERKDVTDHILRKALSRLKSLKSVVLTDWRGLARRTESYGECAHRLFGNTLAPSPMMPHTNEMDTLFDQLIEIIWDGASIEQFSIGAHLFELESERPMNGDSRAPMCISLTSVESMYPIMRKLRRLNLQVDINSELWERMTEDSKDPTPRTLEQASALQHLTLAIHLPKYSRLGERNLDLETVVYRKWLANQSYPRLRTMKLRGWTLPQAYLEAFLARHVSTLRTIHLINCHLAGDQTSLARWAGENLNLDGIQIGLITGTDVYCLQAQQDGTIKQTAVDTALVPEHEPLWLAGRPNFIVRDRFTGIPRDNLSQKSWWKQRMDGQEI